MRQIRTRSSASDTLSSTQNCAELLLTSQRLELEGPGTSEIINASPRYMNSQSCLAPFLSLGLYNVD
jgi:hypothetical protein